MSFNYKHDYGWRRNIAIFVQSGAEAYALKNVYRQLSSWLEWIWMLDVFSGFTVGLVALFEPMCDYSPNSHRSLFTMWFLALNPHLFASTWVLMCVFFIYLFFLPLWLGNCQKWMFCSLCIIVVCEGKLHSYFCSSLSVILDRQAQIALSSENEKKCHS